MLLVMLTVAQEEDLRVHDDKNPFAKAACSLGQSKPARLEGGLG